MGNHEKETAQKAPTRLLLRLEVTTILQQTNKLNLNGLESCSSVWQGITRKMDEMIQLLQPIQDKTDTVSTAHKTSSSVVENDID